MWLLFLLLGGGLLVAGSSSKPAAPKAAAPSPIKGGARATDTSAASSAALAKAKAVMAIATTPNRQWGPAPAPSALGQGGLPNTVAATATFLNGPGGPSVSGAPLPLPGESEIHYNERVIGGTWAPGGGPDAWINGIADSVGADMFNIVADTLATASYIVDPTGNIADAIHSVNATAQAGIASANDK